MSGHGKGGGLMSRRKGKVGEQQAAQLLRAIFPDVHTKRAGGESASVDRGRDLLGTPGLCVQVKCHGAPQPLVAWREACSIAQPNELPVAFVKQSRRGYAFPWAVVLSAEDFIGLYALARGDLLTVAREQLSRATTTNGGPMHTDTETPPATTPSTPTQTPGHTTPDPNPAMPPGDDPTPSA
jgi:hypothetical protein